MKAFRILTTLVLTLCFLCAPLAVSGDAIYKKIWISHFNDLNSYNNESIIFTQSGIGERTLGNLTANTDAVVKYKQPEWDHLFRYYYTAVCAWDDDIGAYVIQKTSWPSSRGNNEAQYFSVPDNGFILAVHYEMDINGKPYTARASHVFAEQNLSGESWPAWRNIYPGLPIYLYHVDLEAADGGLKTDGSFFSAISPEGIANNFNEVYLNFSTESYAMIGNPDPNALVSPYRPANVKISTRALQALVDESQRLDEYDYSVETWSDYQKALLAVDLEKEGLTQDEVDGWYQALSAARNALRAPSLTKPQTTDKGDGDPQPDENGDGEALRVPTAPKNEGQGGALIIVGIVAGVLVLAGVSFLLFALNRKKQTAKPPEENK